MRKLRSDSTFARLSEEQRATVDDMFIAGCSYEDVKNYMTSLNLSVSATSCAEYYQVHVRARLTARLQRASIAVNEAAGGMNLDEATMATVKQQAFEMLISPQFDTLAVQRLFGILFKAKALDQSAERIGIMQLRASENLLDKAMSDDVQAIVGADDSRSEKLQKLTQLLFGDLA